MILPADELDDLQQVVADIYADTMPDLLFIQRTTADFRDPENPEVTVSEFANKVYDNVPCSYREATPRETDLVATQQKLQLLAIEVAPTYQITSEDRGEIYAKGQTPAIPFEVIAARKESNATSYTIFAHVL